ncbi:MAG: arsenate reductase ArsC [Bdellovibrionales bacterium]|nr:arsenate reductase ArsC [Bdellovibrionales bacterium]NQZ19223.1 arsenate reductase ArsC [Bdellovibrionales bacterium]
MKKVLFLCVANSARSQMAEALAKNIWKEKAQVLSAGSAPSGRVNPFAVEAVEAIDIDMSEHFSKGIETLPKDFVDDLDYVITLCAEEACPISPSAKAQVLAWPYPDPEKLSDFQTIRDQLQERLRAFATEW